MFLSQIIDNEFIIVRLVNCILVCVAIAMNVVAIIVDEGRTREHLMYGRDNIFAFVYFLLFLQSFDFFNMHELFGPWAVIIKSLVVDVVKFMVVLLLFIMVFTCHMCVIYKPVYNKQRLDFPEGLTTANEKNDFRVVLQGLFFACFGLTTRPTQLTSVERNDNPAETYYIATVVFALYQIIVIIVLINLLIAMMSDTYARIEQRSAIEWRYGRGSVIWRMTKTESVPIPVNIFSAFIVLLKIMWESRLLCCFRSATNLYQEMMNIHGLEEDEEDDSSDNKSKKGKRDDDPEDPQNRKKKIKRKHITKAVPWREVVEEYKVEKYSEESEA